MQNMVMKNTIPSYLSCCYDITFVTCYIFFYILLIMFFYDWSIYNPINTSVGY